MVCCCGTIRPWNNHRSGIVCQKPSAHVVNGVAAVSNVEPGSYYSGSKLAIL